MDAALRKIYNLADTRWGDEVRYKSRGTSYKIFGIFDEPYQLVEVAEAGFSSRVPIFTMVSSALPCKPTIGDLLFFQDDVYTVRNFRADGTGITVLQLEFATEYETPTENNLLLQDGSNLLLEDSAFILLEVSN